MPSSHHTKELAPDRIAALAAYPGELTPRDEVVPGMGLLKCRIQMALQIAYIGDLLL
jgi:hypothetical protein